MHIEPGVWQPPLEGQPLGAVVVEHAEVRLVVLPERGGKIVSMRYLPTNTEWLWQNCDLPWQPAAPTDSYVAQHDLGGWDECFPTVAATTVAGREWPDHGDLWWRSWQSEQRGDTLWMGTVGAGYHFERTIHAAPKGFRLDYTVTNTGPEPLPYLWCAHPLLCVEPPLQLELAGRPRLYLGNDSPLGSFGEEHRWPKIEGRSLEQIGKPSGLAAKLFVEVEKGEVRLYHADGVCWEIRWPVETLPFLALWINEEGWSGIGGAPYCNLGVEPSTGAPDDLAIALSGWETARVLRPGEQDNWWLELTFVADS